MVNSMMFNEVVGVVKLQHYKACIKCNAKVQEEETEILGCCGKCEMMQNMEICKEQWMAEISRES